MKVKLRRTNNEDIDSIYELHAKCFIATDQWYKSAIKNYLDTGFVITTQEDTKVIGVLLQGTMYPCTSTGTSTNEIHEELDSEYKEDIFEPVTDNGRLFMDNKLQYTSIKGIVMICIDPEFRGKGLGKKLIDKHFKANSNQVVCLNTRRSNINAYNLYKKMGYEHIAFIKNKYFLPNEDSIFMIKDLTE
jgi:ribosomal protein S18 acetylase RimI-like enzyme